jgi:biopolymer transport protein ExbD
MKLKRVDTINVIPFIDIMLVLLVIVLTTTTFIKKEVIPVKLPKAANSQKSEQKKPVVIGIKANGTLLYNKEEITLKSLATKLAALKKTDPVELHSDKQTSFENFVGVMEILTQLKHKELYIVTIKN